MLRIAGVRFKSAGKIYDFNACDISLNPGDEVIVETEQGLGFAHVANPVREQKKPYTGLPLKKILRYATDEDRERFQENMLLETEAYGFCKKEAENLGLPMHLFFVESTFDGSKLTFFFTSENRIDFRQLVKNLVREYRVRIEMRQVGIRHQAKMCGGIGRCGRHICCSSFIEKFDPVSIRMAKEQGLSLNPTKISGLCGRLMCCLTYENSTYKDLKTGAPKIGKHVMTPKGKGRVVRHNVIAGRVAVHIEGGVECEFPLCDISLLQGTAQQIFQEKEGGQEDAFEEEFIEENPEDSF